MRSIEESSPAPERSRRKSEACPPKLGERRRGRARRASRRWRGEREGIQKGSLPLLPREFFGATGLKDGVEMVPHTPGAARFSRRVRLRKLVRAPSRPVGRRAEGMPYGPEALGPSNMEGLLHSPFPPSFAAAFNEFPLSKTTHTQRP
jgi:hypothetical protein